MPLPIALAGAYAGNFLLQHHFGSQDDFFDGRFITHKEPEHIAEFYQAEDLLKIIAIFPFIFEMVMNKVEPDVEPATEDTALLSLDETHFSVRLFGLDVSFEIIEQERENADGEMETESFMRHERFIDWVPILADFGKKILLWDQTWVYGFKRLDDGSFEVYHHGERFDGPWPVRLVVFFHQYYVLWACKRYINGDAFGTEDIDRQQEEMANIPLHVWREFIAKLRTEKEKSLEAQRKDPQQNRDAIAESEASLEMLRTLSQRQESTISVAKRPLARSVTKARRDDPVKLIVGDTQTQEALQTALKDAKENRAVNDAMKNLVKSPDLKFGERSLTRGLSRANTRKPTNTAPQSS